MNSHSIELVLVFLKITHSKELGLYVINFLNLNQSILQFNLNEFPPISSIQAISLLEFLL